MDPDDIRSRIIKLLKEKKSVKYKDLVATLGCETERIFNSCETLRFEKLATDIDGVGIEATAALFRIPIPTIVVDDDDFTSHHRDPVFQQSEQDIPQQSTDRDSLKSTHFDPSGISIFISYGRYGDGLALAERLEQDLRDKKYEVYRDVNPERGLQGGHDWEWELEKQIESRMVFLSLLTCHAVRRPDGYCLDEISLARSLQKKIIPLLVENTEGGKVCRPPLCIHRLNFLDYQQWKTDYEQRFPALIRAIHTDQVYDGLSIRLLSGQGTLRMTEFDFTGEIGRKAKGFVGRSWLTGQIESWLNRTEEQVFLLKGGPGTGKSAFLAYLAQHHPAVKAVHFCIRSHEATRNPEQFICSIASMIASQIPSYRKLLDSLVQSDSFLRKTPGDLLWDLVIHPLEKPMIGQEQVLILIDALDESVEREQGQSQIVRLISEQLMEKRFPPWIRFLISTRPVPKVLSAFQGYPGCDLTESEPKLNEDDMKKYMTGTIASTQFHDAMLKKRWDTDSAKLQEMLLCASNGNFLYLILILEDIKKGYINPFERSFFPSGLAEYYQINFDRIYEETGRYEKTRRVLDLILASREPLPVWLIGDLLAITPKQVKELLEPILAFFEVEGNLDDTRYRPFHGSFSDWLIGEKTGNDVPVQYQVDLTEGHQLISRYMEKRYADGVHDRFVLSHLPYHLFHAGRFQEYGDLLLNFTYLDEKVKAKSLGISTLIEDYSWAEGSVRIAHTVPNEKLQALKLIQGALTLSAHVLLQKPNQLPSQLVGRLLGIENPVIRKFVDQINRFNKYLWLRPISHSFTPPGGPLIRTLSGHKSWVRAVTVTPDGRQAISGSKDMTLKVWDLESGAELASLAGHTDWICAVAVTPDGHQVISSSDDKSLKVWDLESGRELATLYGHTDSVKAVAVTPDGKRMVSGSSDYTLKVWNLETGWELATLSGHTDKVRVVAVTPNGRLAISGSDDRTLKVWDLESGRELATLVGHTDTVSAAAVTPDSRTAISGSWDKTLKIWDLESGRELATLFGHTDSVNTLAVIPDSYKILSGSRDNTLKIWDLETGKELATLVGHTDPVISVAVTPDSHRAISGSWDNSLKVWNLDIDRERTTPTCHKELITAVAMIPNSGKAISSSDDKTLKVWDLDNGRELHTLTGHTNSVKAVAVTPDGRQAISASEDKTLKIWDLENGRELHTLTGHTYSVKVVVVTPDGRRTVSGSVDKTLKVWDLESGCELHTLTGHTGLVNAVAVTPDSCRAVSGSVDKTLKVWDLESGRELHTLTGHTSWVNVVAVTPDGRRAVSGSNDTNLKVWDLESGRELHTLTGHTSWVNVVAVTPDGRRAVSGSVDKTLKVWDLESGRELATLTSYTGPVWAMTLTMDGRRAVSGSADKTLKVWDLEKGTIIAEFYCDGSISACGYSENLGTIIAGDDTGRIYILRFENGEV